MNFKAKIKSLLSKNYDEPAHDTPKYESDKSMPQIDVKGLYELAIRCMENYNNLYSNPITEESGNVVGTFYNNPPVKISNPNHRTREIGLGDFNKLLHASIAKRYPELLKNIYSKIVIGEISHILLSQSSTENFTCADFERKLQPTLDHYKNSFEEIFGDLGKTFIQELEEEFDEKTEAFTPKVNHDVVVNE